MLQIFYKKSSEEPLTTISEMLPGCWVHVDEASSEELQQLSLWTGIDYATLADCLDKYEIPRVEKRADQLLVFTRYPTDQEVGLYTSTLTLIIAKEAFITVCPQRCLLIQNFIEQNPRLSTQQSSKLLLQLLMRISQEFTAQIRRVRYNVLSAEKEMIHVDSDDITALTKHEEILNQYLSAITPLRTALLGFSSGKWASFYEKEKEQIDDLLNAFLQSEELCSNVIKSIRSLRDAYQIIFTNNLHKTIKLLTALTIILSIPTMIASIYGMNVRLPLAQSSFAFVTVMCFTGVFSLFALWVFRRKGWL